MNHTTKHITLSQLQIRIKEGIDAALPLPVWVCAEISELKLASTGHCYLELVEKGGNNQVPKAKVSAVIWRSSFEMIRSYFESTTGKRLAVGMKILAKVSINYHELYGLSLVVAEIDPLYTLGDMELQRQQTIQQLQKDGVYDMNRSLELPFAIQRVAVISSLNAAGYQDFMQELARSDYRFEVTLFEALMQGNESENSIVEALERIAAEEDSFDAIVIIRGGGSQSDLACFSSYRLCAHVAQMPLPVITGIGHDKDQSIADLVAAVPLKTPTAVATYLVANLDRVDGALDAMADEMRRCVIVILNSNKRKVQGCAQLLMQVSSDFTRKLELRLASFSAEVKRRSELSIKGGETVLERKKQLLHMAINTLITNNKNKLTLSEGLINSRRPESILSLGFAIVRQGGMALKSGEKLSIGTELEITLATDVVTAEVKKIKKSK